MSKSRHEAVVQDPQEMRMGSPQYGRLILDEEEFVSSQPQGIESDSLVWSDDGRLLATQELDLSIPYPGTRAVVIDANRRIQIAASKARKGLSNPIRFEGETLVYRHWQYGPAFGNVTRRPGRLCRGGLPDTFAYPDREA